MLRTPCRACGRSGTGTSHIAAMLRSGSGCSTPPNAVPSARSGSGDGGAVSVRRCNSTDQRGWRSRCDQPLVGTMLFPVVRLTAEPRRNAAEVFPNEGLSAPPTSQFDSTIGVGAASAILRVAARQAHALPVPVAEVVSRIRVPLRAMSLPGVHCRDRNTTPHEVFTRGDWLEMSRVHATAMRAGETTSALNVSRVA